MSTEQKSGALTRLRQWARTIKRDVIALYLAARDPRVPWYAKLLAAAIAAYALSPIDLIPDFVPVLGYLDEVILLPIAIVLVIKLIPPALMIELRAAAMEWVERPVSWVAAGMIVLIWAMTAALLLWLFWPGFAS